MHLSLVFHQGVWDILIEYRTLLSLSTLLLLRCGGEGGRRHVVEEEAISVSHRRIDGHSCDVPPGPENVPLLLICIAFIAIAEDDVMNDGDDAMRVGDVLRRQNSCY